MRAVCVDCGRRREVSRSRLCEACALEHVRQAWRITRSKRGATYERWQARQRMGAILARPKTLADFKSD